MTIWVRGNANGKLRENATQKPHKIKLADKATGSADGENNHCNPVM